MTASPPCHFSRPIPPHIGALLFVLLAILLSLAGCSDNQQRTLQGYAEGDFVLIASPLSGQLETLSTSRGKQVARGDELFTLDHSVEQAVLAAATEQVKQAESRLDDLRKGLRPSELQALRARREKAGAALELARLEYERRRKLAAREVIAKEDLDRARSTLKSAQAAYDDLRAQEKTARLGSRSDIIAAARATLGAAHAARQQAQRHLEQKVLLAPQAALVYDTLFEPGEFVPAGYPVVSLLPPQNIKVRFFVPEPKLAQIALGAQVSITLDGNPATLPAVISYISPRAEYTPPLIYSRETRAKLVYLVEARPTPEVAAKLHPGQPLDVRLGRRHD